MTDAADQDLAEAACGPFKPSDLYRFLFEDAADGIFVSDRRGRCVAANPRGCELTGYTGEELRGLNIYRLLMPDDHAGTPVRVDELRQGRIVTLEWRIRRKDGVPLPVEVSLRLLPDGCLLGVVRDTGERRRAAAALLDMETRYNQLAEQTRTFLWEVDVSGLYTFVSPTVQLVLGYAPEELTGRVRFYELHPEEGRAAFRAGALAVFARKAYFVDLHNEVLTRDGRHVWLSTYGVPILAANGELCGYRGGDIDISQRMNVEEALRQSDERLRALIESAPFGAHLYELDEHDRLVFRGHNASANRILAVDNAQFLGKAIEEAFPALADTDIPARYREVAATGVGYEAEQITYDHGQIRGAYDVHAFQTAPRRMAAFFTDITERKHADEERQKLQTRLHQSQKMESIGRLAGGVAHDFNNMLGVILGHTDLALSQTAPSHPASDHLQQIGKAAERSANLTRQLLAFARKQTVAPKVIDVNETVDGMLRMLGRLIGEDIDLVWAPDRGLWDVKVDPTQIDQILANLCVNARDAIEGVGKVTIETSNVTLDSTFCAAHPGTAPGEYVLLAVSDNGCGMTKEVLDHLFEPFFTTKGIGHGTGMGLPTVYGIVTQNHGSITVYSEVGHGTTVKVYLPRFAEKAEAAEAEKPAPIDRGRETILVVEDEPANLNMCRLMLERSGYHVLTAASPSQAIELAKAQAGRIGLLLTDVVMPEMNGRELADAIAALCPDIRRMFMSGYTANVIAHHGVLEDGVHFLQKPFTMRQLATQVREALDAR